MSKQKITGKKEQFVKNKNSRGLFLPVIAVVLVLAAVITFYKPAGSDEPSPFGEPLFSPRSYVQQLVSMTPVETVIEDSKIKVPLSQVDSNNIVSFEVENDEGTPVPLMAYVTPSGRLFAGSSMCEPCRGRAFSLAGETMVCDACRTTYTIEDHQFLSGAVICGSYPPVYMSPVIEDDWVTIDLDQVLNWRLRAL